MHPTLAAFAASYRHRFPDLTITEVGGELRLEWQEAPTSPCYAVTLRQTHYGPAVVVETGVFVVTDGDILKTLVTVMARERGPLAHYGTSARGSFAALVLMHATLRGLPVPPPARPMSPDCIN